MLKSRKLGADGSVARAETTMVEYPKVGVGILIRRADDLLLVRRDRVHGSGTWSTPGGHLNLGERPEVCARREASEETGVEVSHIRFRAVTNDVFDSNGLHYVTLWMEADYLRGEPKVSATYELSDVRWFRWDSLPAQLFLSFANLLDGRCYPPERGGLSSLRAGLV